MNIQDKVTQWFNTLPGDSVGAEHYEDLMSIIEGYEDTNYKELFEAAKAYIDVSVGDPDVNDETYNAYMEYTNLLEQEGIEDE